MALEARCRTTAMGIMPHTNVEKALELAQKTAFRFFQSLVEMFLFFLAEKLIEKAHKKMLSVYTKRLFSSQEKPLWVDL